MAQERQKGKEGNEEWASCLCDHLLAVVGSRAGTDTNISWSGSNSIHLRISSIYNNGILQWKKRSFMTSHPWSHSMHGILGFRLNVSVGVGFWFPSETPRCFLNGLPNLCTVCPLVVFSVCCDCLPWFYSKKWFAWIESQFSNEHLNRGVVIAAQPRLCATVCAFQKSFVLENRDFKSTIREIIWLPSPPSHAGTLRIPLE